MKKFLYILFFMISNILSGQTDTIVVRDYTKVMISTSKSDGTITPITNLKGLTQVGFFLNEIPKGKIRVCNDEIIYVWVSGKLAHSFSGCDLLDPQLLALSEKTDTTFLSFTTAGSFSNFRCELLKFEELQVIKEDLSKSRTVRNAFSEFVFISAIIILFFLGIFAGYHPQRIAYIFKKTFTFKTNAYEFVNTDFLSTPSFIALGVLSVLLGFLGVYTNQLLSLRFFESYLTVFGLLYLWAKLSFSIFSILILKRFLVDAVSSLFKFKGLRNYQMFDFINFNIFFFTPITLFVLLDFIFFNSVDSYISNGFLWVFPLVLILFLIWSILKFVNHSPRRKLIIISYLCATEIMPAIFLLGWFFK